MTNSFPITNIGTDFAQMVMGNMVKVGRGIAVRFGTTGRGVYPNYEVRYADGTVRAFRGRTHQLFFGGEGRFSDGHLSREYGFEEIVALAR